MRETTVHRSARLILFQAILPGHFKNLCRSYGVTIIVASMIGFIAVQESHAQTFDFCTDCNGTSGFCDYPAISTNPDLAATCPNIDITFILDESGSVGTDAVNVKNGVLAFLNALNGTGVNISIIEFNDLARRVTDYTCGQQHINHECAGIF